MDARVKLALHLDRREGWKVASEKAREVEREPGAQSDARVANSALLTTRRFAVLRRSRFVSLRIASFFKIGGHTSVSIGTAKCSQIDLSTVISSDTGPALVDRESFSGSSFQPNRSRVFDLSRSFLAE